MSDHWIVKATGRQSDMNPARSLRIERHADGDFVIAIVDEGGLPLGFGHDDVASVEFCTSGGHSQEIMPALYELMKAIDRANENVPEAKPAYLAR